MTNKEGSNVLKIRKGDYDYAEQRRIETRKQTGLSLVWGDALEHGINAIYDTYVNNGENTLLNTDDIRNIIDADPRGDGYANIWVHDRQYEPAYRIKQELTDEWGLDITWADVLLVGVEEIFAQIKPAPQPETVEA